jgi:diguanylate cyclase (GGDEF)-like protein
MTRRAGAGRHRWRWPHILGVVVVVVTLAAYQNMVSHRRGEAETTIRGLLSQLDLLLHEESDLQWRTLADRSAPVHVAREVGAIRQQEDAILARLRTTLPDRQTPVLQGMVSRYHEVLDQELGLLAVSRTADALALERHATDPQFTALSRETTRLGDQAGRRARRADRVADLTLVVALLLATIMIGLLIRKFEHVHRAAVQTSSELLQQERKALRQAQLSESTIKHQALHDALTELPNRRLFTERVEQASQVETAAGQGPAVLFVDLDDFKRVNDSLGHAAGDELLVAVAERVRARLREPDTAARLGGDEFAVLLDRGGAEAATLVARRLIAALAEPFVVAGTQVQVQASIGIAVAGDHSRGAAELLCNADMAMYAAKQQGKGRFALFEPGMDAPVRGRLELEADLRRALELDQFTLVYQPVVELTSGRIVAAEALLRWQHPRLGLVPPAHFIPVAEETGLIVPIGQAVLERACAQAQAWIAAGAADASFTISVNLSSRQLRHADLVDDVASALAAANLDPARLVLEITEGAVLEDTDQVLATLTALRALGLRLALDDFGTGYSSLRHLHRLPVDQIKIDRSFVNPSADGRADMVAAILQLSHTLQLETVAEGIEALEQAERLRALGCQLGQGYYFARPLQPASFEELLAASHGGWAAEMVEVERHPADTARAPASHAASPGRA